MAGLAVDSGNVCSIRRRPLWYTSRIFISLSPMVRASMAYIKAGSMYTFTRFFEMWGLIPFIPVRPALVSLYAVLLPIWIRSFTTSVGFASAVLQSPR